MTDLISCHVPLFNFVSKAPIALRSGILTTTILLVAPLLWSGHAMAEESEYAIEEVIVTAQKREQSMQDVPIAISAFDSEFLEDAGVDDILELQFFVPGLTVYNNQSPAQTNFNVRGVGTAGNSLSLESSVGIYVDGVYRSRQSSAIGDLIDVERLEVLKGPQGTLFGRNTASGAVQFLTAAPSMDSFDGFVEVQGGSEGYRHIKGVLNIPASDTVAFRLSGGTTARDGYVKNITSGADLNERDRFSLRAQMLVDVRDNISVRVIADHSVLDEKCCSATNSFDGPGDTIALFLGAGGALPPTGQLPNVSYVLPIEALGGDVVLANDFNDDVTAMNIDPYADIEESGLSIEVNWDLDNGMTVTSLTGYRSYDATSFVDADFSSLDTLSASGGNAEQDTFTQEFRIAGDFGDTGNFVAGIYYFDQQLDNHTTLRLGTTANVLLTGGLTNSMLLGGAPVCAAVGMAAICDDPAFPTDGHSDNFSVQDQTSWAVFSQADFNVSDNVVLTIGLRYLDEQKDMDVIFTESIFSLIWDAFTPLSPFVPDVNDVQFDDTNVTGTAKLSYFVNDNLMTYVSFGRGYKSGGTNIDRISPATGAPLLFDPETSDAYEVGFKGDFMDRRLRVNAALYLIDFEDFQANTFVGTGFVLQNAGAIDTRGLEVDVQALLAPWLSLTAGTAYVDAEYDSFIGGSCILTPYGSEPDAAQAAFPTVCDATGNRVASTPKWTYFASLSADRQLRNGASFYGRLDVNWKDDNPSGTDNDPNKTADSYTLTNLHLGYRTADERYTVSLWAKNLFDEDYRNGAFNSVIRQGSLSAYHTEPRTVGVTFRANFN
jgi:iron complex outermembrane recepter protein